MKSLVVIPTYNEAENIGRIVPTTLEQDPDLQVLVVDDNSPDGTADIVRSLQAFGTRLHLLSRPVKAGLGAAYIAGFQWALRETQAEAIFEMDADFSHDPCEISNFLREIRDYDVVLGSRYLGGVTVVNWPLRRLMLSVGANIYARWVTGMPIKDCTGGYKCFRRHVLEALPLDRIRSDGYSFQIEMNYHCWKRGFRIKEIPILFVDRQVGVSKMNKRIIWEAMWIVWSLRLRRIP